MLTDARHAQDGPTPTATTWSAEFRDGWVQILPWIGAEPDEVDPRSSYVEKFWLPVLGPTATWLMRRFADEWDTQPAGFALNLEEVAISLGLGTASSRHSPLRRSIGRCVRFGLARSVGVGAAEVRRRMPPVPRRHLLRLPTSIQGEHRDWEAATARNDEGVLIRRRARLVALDLRDLGVDDACIERHLLRRGVHPAIAFEAARWAWSPEGDGDRPYGVCASIEARIASVSMPTRAAAAAAPD